MITMLEAWQADLSNKVVRLPASVKRKVQDAIANVIQGNYFKSIPLGEIFQALENENIIAVDEDGSRWSGFLTGRDGRAKIDLVYSPNGDVSNSADYFPIDPMLILSWYKMDSGNYEVNAYLS